MSQRLEEPGENILRYRRGIQTTRAATYNLSLLIGITFQQIGVLGGRLLDFAVMFVVANATVLAFLWLGRHARMDRRAFDVGWMSCDVLLVTWGVYMTGGFSSAWFVWYVATAGSAAFVFGNRGAIAVCVANSVCYLAMLFVIGDLQGFGSSFLLALGRMVFLHGAASFFLRGVSDLQAKRQDIKRLMDNESRKVEELTRLTAALDQRTHELSEANVRIREADRLKSQFLANMSHELRTPLNSIIGFSEILETRLADQIAAKHLRFLQNINSSGQHLLGIINDILDLSKIEAGKMEVSPETFAVRGVVEGVCHVMKGVASRRSISIRVDIPADLPAIETDPVKLKQILYNLLSNAVKFSPDGSEVVIEVAHVAAAESSMKEDSMRFSVTDQGIGIHPKDHDLIFQEFRQADGTATRKYEGTGLGLSLVRSLLTLQRGAVSLKSAPGLGSTFIATLPLRYSPGGIAVAPAEPDPRPDDGTKRVLVIEDDPTAYELIEKALLDTPYVPMRARTGEEAIVLAKAWKPAAITLDLVLPGVDGWEVLKTLKADSVTSGIPVIIISIMDNHELGMALGADGYFLKPVDREDLLGRLKELLPIVERGPSTLLLIDDDQDIHDMLDDLLSRQGYLLNHALSGREGIENAKRQRPDLVILDLMMEEMDGFEVAAALKDDPATASIPILVLTARDLTSSDRTRLSGKVASLVRKGDAEGRLASVIGEIVGRRAVH